jgi:hypothetical protein
MVQGRLGEDAPRRIPGAEKKDVEGFRHALSLRASQQGRT